MVCLGNICRSPLAEGIMKSKIEQQKLNLSVDSAGTADYHVGESPDLRSQENARAHGIDISMLRGRQFSIEDFDRFDRIFAMDSSNYKNILALAQNSDHEKKVQMILNIPYPGSDKSVPDPYYGGEQGFENVFQLLDHACDKIIEEIINE